MPADLENSSDEHRMVPGSHERPGGAECVCGGAWDRWMEQCVNQKGVTRRG